jgi:UDP-3-O-[3-hydroxymyristoyl] N-acetylglucosamine deacetylase
LELIEGNRDVAYELPMLQYEEDIRVTQQTIKRAVSCIGVGLHTGKRVFMRLRSAPAGSGIRFSRLDLPGRPVVAARFDQVVQTDFATTLGLNGVTISTTEHLLAAFFGRLIKEAGIEQQPLPRHFLKVSRPLEVRDGDAYIRVWPSEQLQITYTIDYPHPMLGRQTSRWRFNRSSFEAEIAGARTFGFLKDLDQLQAKGLARGGSLANAMVFDEDRLLNHDGFRFGDECVRHKILDFMGDLALVGRPVLASFEAYKAGHTLHNRLVRQLLATPDRYQIFPATPVHPVMFNIPEAIAPVRLPSFGI